MTRTILSMTRNLLFDIFAKDSFHALVGFRAADIHREQLWHHAVIYNQEEIERLAISEAEKFMQSPLKRLPFILGTKPYLFTTYVILFIESYNLALQGQREVR